MIDTLIRHQKSVLTFLIKVWATCAILVIHFQVIMGSGSGWALAGYLVALAGTIYLLIHLWSFQPRPPYHYHPTREDLRRLREVGVEKGIDVDWIDRRLAEDE